MIERITGRRDLWLLLAGLSLIAGGLAFLADSCAWRPLLPGLSRGIPALLVGLGLVGAWRLHQGMRWAILPAVFFLLVAATHLLRPLPMPGEGGSPLVLVAFALLLLLLVRPRLRRWWPIVPAGGLLALGVGMGLDRAGWAGAIVIPLFLFFGLGLASVGLHLLAREHLWPLLLALLALLIGLIVLVEQFAPDRDAGGVVFLAGLGAGFLLLHLRRRESWWPVIPGGILGSLGLSLLAGTFISLEDRALAALFILGTAATFGYLYFSGVRLGQRGWARFPAVGLVSLALLILLAEGGGSGRVSLLLALGMLGLGLFLLLRAWRARRGA